MAKVNTPQVNISMPPSATYSGTPLAIFIPTFNGFETFKVGKEVTLVGPDGTTETATVRQKRFAPLFEVLNAYGPQTYLLSNGIPYSPEVVVEDVEALYPGEQNIGHVGKWYTVLLVQRDAPAVPTPPA